MLSGCGQYEAAGSPGESHGTMRFRGARRSTVPGGFALAFIDISLRAYLPEAWMPFREPLGG